MSDPVGAQSREPWARRYLPDKRPTWKKVLTPLVLAGVGVVLFLAAVREYPSTPARLSTPPHPSLEVDGAPLAVLEYSVNQVQPNIAEVGVVISTPIRRPTRAVESVEIDLPSGATLLRCLTPGCKDLATGSHSIWVRQHFDRFGDVSLTIRVRARSLNVASNGINASVAIPSIFYHIWSSYPKHRHYKMDKKDEQMNLTDEYRFSSPTSYDWSASPPYSIIHSRIRWIGHFAIGYNPERIVVGINYARQANDNRKTFIAGALLGLAGGAILSAIQELLHAND
jgi:hypothetical protein